MNEDFGKKLKSLLKEINCEIAERIGVACKSCGVTCSQSLAVQILFSRGAISLKELSEKMRTPPSNCTNVCARLEKAGYIERKRSEYDKRCILLDLTLSGKELAKRLEVMHEQVTSGINSDVAKDYRKDILHGLNLLKSALKKEN